MDCSAEATTYNQYRASAKQRLSSKSIAFGDSRRLQIIGNQLLGKHRPKFDVAKWGFDRTKVYFTDIKVGYVERELTEADASRFVFKHISSWKPKDVQQYGLNPLAKGEIDIKVNETAFVFHGSTRVFQFIFAMPDIVDNETYSKMLERLGWLEGIGDTESTAKYMYVFRLPPGTAYASSQGKVAKNTEIMFPDLIFPSDILHAYRLQRSNGRMQKGKRTTHSWRDLSSFPTLQPRYDDRDGNEREWVNRKL